MTDDQLAEIVARLARNYPVSSLDVRALLDDVCALRDERDRYKEALEEIARNIVACPHCPEIAMEALKV